MNAPEPIEFNEPITLRFVERWHEYDDVYSFRLQPDRAVPFLAGQNVRIVVPELSEEEGRRSLSIASPPQDEALLFSMHTRSESVYKQAFLELTDRDTVDLVKVKGVTVLPDEPSIPVVCIAGGVGVTPFRSMLFDIHTRGLPTNATLIHVSSGPHLYENELEALPYTQHRIGRPDVAEQVRRATKEHQNGMFYVAGSPAFIEAIQTMLTDVGIEEAHIRVSRFTGYDELLD